MIIDLTGYNDESVAVKTNLMAEQLMKSNLPRIAYPIGQDENVVVVDTVRNYYFGRYFDGKSNDISSGATFSLKGLDTLPDFYSEGTYGIMFIEEKTNTGFLVHIMEPTKYDARPHDVKTLELDLVKRTYRYEKNNKEYKTSYTNIDNFFNNIGVLNIKNILFALSPREYPLFYHDMYRNLATRNHEYTEYLGRFFERLLEYSKIEVLYKSGLPRDIVIKYTSEIIEKKSYFRLLDPSATSARMMLKLPKVLWKQTLKGNVTYEQLKETFRVMSKMESLEQTVEETARNKSNMVGFDKWLERKLPELRAYSDTAMKSNPAFDGYVTSQYRPTRDKYRLKRQEQERINRESMSPQVLAYYKIKYSKHKKKVYHEYKESVKNRRRRLEENIKSLQTVVTHVNKLNQVYGINHMPYVIKGEGVNLVGGIDDVDNTAIGIHNQRGFDLYRVLMYIYYECPLDQGYKIRGFQESKNIRTLTKDYEAFTRNEDSTYVDYLDMVSRTSKNYDRYPKHLKTAHDIAVSNMVLIDNAEISANLKEKTLVATQYEQYKVPKGRFFVKAPRTVQEFVEEGNNMGNCIAGYVHSVLAGTKHILFMRHKDAPDKARVNIEIRNGAIVQVEGRFRAKPTADEYEFIHKFAVQAGLQMKV